MPALPPSLFVNVFHGEPTFGVWCPKCLLSSGIKVELFMVSMKGVTSMGRYGKCGDCGSKIQVAQGD